MTEDDDRSDEQRAEDYHESRRDIENDDRRAGIGERE